MTFNLALGNVVDEMIQKLAAVQTPAGGPRNAQSSGLVPVGRGWYQGDYRCGTGMCVAGWTREVANDGSEWLTPETELGWSDRILLPEDIDAMPYPEAVRKLLKERGMTWREFRDNYLYWGSTFLTEGSTFASRVVASHPGITDSQGVISADAYATTVLGLDRQDSIRLFSGNNSAEYIADAFERLRRGDAVPYAD